jgi:hypothetical protein
MKEDECGRRKIEIKIMDYEKRERMKINIMLRMGEKMNDIVKDIESGKNDIV